MKQGKAIEKESTTALNANYCPYCGSANLSLLKDKIVCRSCRASFVTARCEEARNGSIKFSTIASRDSSISDRSSSLHISPLPSSQPAVSVNLLEFNKALDILDVPRNIREAARTIYSKTCANEMSTRSGCSDKGMAAAVIYAVCNQNGLSKSLEEIAGVFGIDRAEVEGSYTFLLNEIGYWTPLLGSKTVLNEPESQLSSILAAKGREQASFDAEKFLEKKGTYEFLRLLKERPRRWKTLEKELPLSPRTLSERISQAQELGFIEKVRRLKIGATYYRLTKKGNDVFEAMTVDARIY
ncbi:MAG TPA: hypothetical protein VMT42_06280 [candidate division Zixibacteria bacterium]|nr:hypothetical protein [candidate division Zixibacteria bacterium]